MENKTVNTGVVLTVFFTCIKNAISFNSTAGMREFFWTGYEYTGIKDTDEPLTERGCGDIPQLGIVLWRICCNWVG